MRILFVIEYFLPHLGGVEQVTFEVGRRLAEKSHEVTILTTQEKNEAKSPFIFQKIYLFGMVKVYTLEKMNIVRIFTPPFIKRYLFPIISFPALFYFAAKTDLVHSTNNYTVAFPVFVVAQILNKPVTLSVWEIWKKLWYDFFPKPIAFFYLLYEKLILTLPFDKFISPSKFVSSQFESKNKTIIGLGHKNLKPDKKRAKLLQKKYNLSGQYIFFYFGRFGKSKGIEHLIPAFANASKKYKDLILILNIPNLDRGIKEKINQELINLRIRKKTVLLSGIPKDKLAGFMTVADCIVTPDLTISFGLATLEASQMGKPIVTSIGGALKEVAFGKVIYVKPGNVKSLSQGLIKARQNRFQRIAKKDFSWDKTAKNYETVFLSVSRLTSRTKSKSL